MASVQKGSVLDRTVLKQGQIFLVTDSAGDVRALNREGHGLYYRDTRHLSLLEMDIGGTRLTLLSAAGELNFMSNLQFANDALLDPSGAMIAEARTISIRRNRFLHDDGLHERLGLLNYNPHPVQLTVRLTFGADFRDMFEVRGYFPDDHSMALGEIYPIELLPDGILLGYRGRDDVERHTRVTFVPAPTRVDIVNDRLRRIGPAEKLPGLDQWNVPREEDLVIPVIAAAVFTLDVPPNEFRSITVHIALDASDVASNGSGSTPKVDRGRELDAAFIGMRDSYDEWRSASTLIETDHELFDQLLRGAMQDLRVLTENVGGDLVPTAGIPWFAVPFGRDALITAMETLVLQPAIAAGTLRFLAQHQGIEVNDFRDEQPGKILHEVRLGEMTKLRRVPHNPYFGSVDSTPLFLVALGEYVRWTGDLDLARGLLPNAEAALAWMRDYGDASGDGFLEYHSRSSEGIRNQGWKDSPDSASHRDGSFAEPPIALVEVQAYKFAAHREMAELYARLGEPEKELDQRRAAEHVRGLFVERLSMSDEDGPFWAMGLDGVGRRIETVTSNPGHALWAGLLRGADARSTVKRLLADDMLCGWGIRTLSGRARSFNPMSYHNGSVWPHDNAIIALGMKRAGDDHAAREVASQVFEAGLRFPALRLPELWCGFSRDRRYHSTPAQYPVSCSPQAWAAGSAFMLLQALLGLEADAFEGVVRLRPVLPNWLGRVSMRKMRVAGSQVDFDIIREGHRLIVDVVDDGGLKIETREADREL